MCTPLMIAAMVGGSALQSMGEQKQARAIDRAQARQIEADTARLEAEALRQRGLEQQAVASAQGSIDATAEPAIQDERATEEAGIESRLLDAIATQKTTFLPGGNSETTPRVVQRDLEKRQAAGSADVKNRAGLQASLLAFDNVLRNQNERHTKSSDLISAINTHRQGSLRASDAEGHAVAARGTAGLQKAQGAGSTLRTLGDLLVAGGQIAGGSSGGSGFDFSKLFGSSGSASANGSLPVAM